ncbi:MAG TPA: hypothetical protein VH763_04650 [Gemmatimonadales bacterium]
MSTRSASAETACSIQLELEPSPADREAVLAGRDYGGALLARAEAEARER